MNKLNSDLFAKAKTAIVSRMDKQSLLKDLLTAYKGDEEALISDARRLKRTLYNKHPKKDLTGAPVVASLQGIHKTYKVGKSTVTAANDITFDVHEGEFIALTGPSGSGTSTILNMLGGLDKPDEGVIVVNGQTLRSLSDSQLARYRNDSIGFVFQFFYLQPFLSLQTNVEVPMMFNRTATSERKSRSEQSIRAVGLEDRLTHLPRELSGGQMQRAAIARALMNKPRLLLADEPTGNLDSVNSEAIITEFERICKEEHMAIVMVTHDQKLAGRADRVLEMNDGKLVRS